MGLTPAAARKALARAQRYVEPRWALAGCLSISVLAAISDLANLYAIFLFGTYLSLGSGPSPGPPAPEFSDLWPVGHSPLVSAGGLVLVTVIVRSGLRLAEEATQAAIMRGFTRSVFRRLFSLYFRLPLVTFAATNSTDRLASLTSLIERATLGIRAAMRIVGTLASTLLVAAMVVGIDWRASLFAASCAAIVLLIVRPVLSAADRTGRRLGSLQKEFWVGATEALRAYRTVVVHDALPDVASRVERKLDRYGSEIHKQRIATALLVPIVEISAATFVVIGTAVIVGLTSNPADAIPVVVVLVAAAYRILPNLTSLSQDVFLLESSMPALDTIDGEVAEAVGQGADRDLRYEPTTRSDVLLELEKVSFSYPGGREVLRDVSMCIGPRDRVGVVGPSGTGKTTLVDLMLGLHVPTSGRVLVRLQNRRGPPRLSYVPQAPPILDATCLENVCLGTAHGEEDLGRAQHALDRVGLGNGSKRPLALDEVVGEASSRLSGGEKQRLALARALYRQPDLLVLDEPTASLDDEAEHEIVRLLNSLDDVAMLIITHRQAPLAICHQRFRLSQGQLVPMAG